METTINTKLQKVLKNFLQPNFKVKNDVYLNLLLTHLTEKPSPEDGDTKNPMTNTICPEVLLDWIKGATKLWISNDAIPPPFILSFVLNLAAKISTDEQKFINLNSENIYENLIKVLQTSHNGQPIVQLGFTNLLQSFLSHKSGVHWIIANNYWTEVVNLNMQTQTIYVKKQGYSFVTGLLEKSVVFDEMFTATVVNMLLKPMKEFIATLPGDGKTAPQISNQVAYDLLRPSLCFLRHILEELITGLPANIAVFKIIIAADSWTLIRKILLISHEPKLSSILLNIMSLALVYISYEFFGLDDGKEKLPAKDFFALKFVTQFYELIFAEIEKGNVCNVIQLAYQNHIYWHKSSLKTPLGFRKGVAIEFENQVMVILLLPILVYTFGMAGESILTRKMVEDEFRRDYIVKLLKKSGIKTLQIGYQLKARLSALPDNTEYSICALRHLIQSRKFYTQETGALVFQPLIYCLQDCLTCIAETQIHQFSPQTYTFMYTLLDTIIVYIETFNLTWKDSIVTTCVGHLAYQFLNISETIWDAKLVVQGLKLLNTAISKYMSPNMALLMDTTKESVLPCVGTLLYTKCHNSRWEVRDSALEVIYTMTFNARDKYPAFQKVLLDSDFPQLILQMATTDGEPFVRATAIRCLQVAILVPSLWEKLLEYSKDFYNKIVDILQTEPEGVVRKEAAMLMANVYDEHYVPRKLQSKIYDVMTHAALGDLHWEVKVNALTFWDNVIKRQLKYQGMIDGIFPTFTFSQEHRKIVNLNEAEVRKRLIQVLHTLSTVGCLSVFVNAIQDDCDLEVSKTATRITKGFIELLQKYQVTVSLVEKASFPLSPSSSATSSNSSGHIDMEFQNVDEAPRILIAPASVNATYNPDFSSLSNSSPSSDFMENESINQTDPVAAANVSDQMLDDILNASDMMLLQRIFNPSAQIQQNSVSMKAKSPLPPTEFLKFVYDSVDSHSNEKSDWLSNMDKFESLLDDILREYDDKSETNDMDCY